PCWHRRYGLRRLLLLAPSHECAERAYSYNYRRSMQPRIKVDILIEPPEQHPTSNTKPERSPDEIASEEMADRVEPCDDADVKRAPIERHHEHEEYRYRPHFLSQKFSLL